MCMSGANCPNCEIFTENALALIISGPAVGDLVPCAIMRGREPAGSVQHARALSEVANFSKKPFAIV